MHRSRIGVVLIDHPADRFDAAADFWTTARGGKRGASDSDAEASPYQSLEPLPGRVMLELQRTGTGTAPRIHLDIETDDVEAEISRLTAAGAQIHERRNGYAIMTDPGGLLFCVVPVQTGADFEVHAVAWP